MQPTCCRLLSVSAGLLLAAGCTVPLLLTHAGGAAPRELSLRALSRVQALRGVAHTTATFKGVGQLTLRVDDEPMCYDTFVAHLRPLVAAGASPRLSYRGKVWELNLAEASHRACRPGHHVLKVTIRSGTPAEQQGFARALAQPDLPPVDIMPLVAPQVTLRTFMEYLMLAHEHPQVMGYLLSEPVASHSTPQNPS